METNRINRNPAILQVGGDCDAGESKEEPLFLRPCRANGHGTGPNGPRVPSVSCEFSHFARRRRSWFWTRQYAKVQS